jgi:signal transduction histidine kinase
MRRTVLAAARATGYLAMGAAMTFGTYLFVTVLLITVAGAVAMVGIWLVPETVLFVRRIAGARRARVAAWTGRPLPEAYLPVTGTLRERLRTTRSDPGTYADLRWLVAQYVYGWMVLLALPLWPVGLLVDGLCRRPVVLPLITRLADTEARWSAALLRPSPKAQLAERVEELAATRAGAVAAHGAELRRIERDLHDGTQARLVLLSMRLGLAKRAFAQDPGAALRMLEDAQDQAELALTELRHVVRGIHPPILTDRGLAGAVHALAASSALAVTVAVDGLDSRPPAAVEAAAYFVVAEALTNATKHSGGTHAEVRLASSTRGMTVTVWDDGQGGAAFGTHDGGSGLLGMRRRVAALDGTFAVTSPVGGPTVVEAELPCVW